MRENEYYMPTNWRVKGDIHEVYDVCANFLDYKRWWPSVYLDIQAAGIDEETGNERYSIHSKGWLPYTLRWKFEQDGEFVNVRFDWYVLAEKPLLKYLSPIMKPIFRSNHYWAMSKGLESLQQELDRRVRKDLT